MATNKHFGFAILAACLLALASLGCSVGQRLVGDSGSLPADATRTPRPTFTAGPSFSTRPGARVTVESDGSSQGDGTNLVLIATPTAAASALPTATAYLGTDTPMPTPRPTPFVVVGGNNIVGYRGPGTTFETVGAAAGGTAMMAMARTIDGDWWLVCCIANQPAWVSAEGVEPQGLLDMLPEVTPQPTPEPTATPVPTETPTITPTPLPPFDIARGPEFPIRRDTGIMTIWVKVYEGPPDNQKSLGGYVLKVYRNDVDVSQHAQSHNRPFDETDDSEGRLEQNLKFEMLRAGEADWRIYLARPDGTRMSPISEFTTLGDSYRNLVVYVAYWLAR